ncbi:MAG: hypothetical protein ACLP6G_24135 [Terriglobales bacterium]
MKNLKIPWKLVALFVLGAIGSVLYVTRSRAFTLVEIQYLPAVQLVAGQTAAVTVSNISANNLDVTITTHEAGGQILSTKNATLAPGATTSLVVIAKGGMGFWTGIALGASSSAISDVMTFDKVTGQVIAIAPGELLPAVQ